MTEILKNYFILFVLGLQDLYIEFIIKYRRFRNYLLVILCKYLLRFYNQERVIYAEHLGVDITPIIQCYYFIDRTLSLMTLNVWLSKFFTNIEDITMIRTTNDGLYKSILDFNENKEKITGNDVNDIVLSNDFGSKIKT